MSAVAQDRADFQSKQWLWEAIGKEGSIEKGATSHVVGTSVELDEDLGLRQQALYMCSYSW